MFKLTFLALIVQIIVLSESSKIDLREGIPHATVAIPNKVTFRGSVLHSREDKPYFAFKGIRYAKEPIRFRAPEPLEKNSAYGNEDEKKNVLDAVEFGARCPQKFWATQELLGDEDCLFLNIFVPEVSGSDKFPVLFYIHGGRYTDGEGDTYGPDYFMDEKVVLVTINYRLGVLGFLTTGDAEVPGNMGLRDQALALKWVHDNIQAFNGDPERIVIFGESAGASSVHLQMLYPPNEGFFSGAISQSGTATCGWALQHWPEAVEHATKIGSLVGCDRTDKSSKEFIECLQGKSWKDLILNQSKFSKWLTDRTIPFGPVVEVADQKVTPFISENPEFLLKEGRFIKVPFLTGINEDEGHQIQSAFVLKNPALIADLNENWNQIAPSTFLFGNLIRDRKRDSDIISAKVKEFYFGGQPISVDLRENLTNLYSDVIFVHGIKRTAELMLPNTPDLFLYLFKYKGEFSCTSLMGIKEYLGVTHADDLQYLFFTKKYGSKDGLLKNSESEKISKKLVKLWVSFAETGKPSATWGKEKFWLPAEELSGKSSMKNWYILDSETTSSDTLFEERLKFWDQIVKEYFIDREVAKNTKSEKIEL